MKKIFLVAITVFAVFTAMAQHDSTGMRKKKKEERRERINAIIRQEEEGVIKYKKHLAFGFKLTNDGYGGFVEVARAQSVRRSLLFQLDISERKHPKEEKRESEIYAGTSPFIYGKINYFYPIRLGVQQQFLLGNKGNKNGVSISGNIGGGLSLGLLRPYLVEVDTTGFQDFVYVGYDSPDSALFLNSGLIAGGPNLGTGWKNLKLTPGAYVKAGLRFDYGKYNEMLTAVEVGLSAEFYSKKIPQMIYQKQDRFFVAAYVALVFGRRK
jgi:hypothetical protein